MIPSRKEMMAYWFEHPIAGTFIALEWLKESKLFGSPLLILKEKARLAPTLT